MALTSYIGSVINEFLAGKYRRDGARKPPEGRRRGRSVAFEGLASLSPGLKPRGRSMLRDMIARSAHQARIE